MKKFILELTTADAAPVSLAGGKGHNLLKLTSKGFNVPGGFLVNTEAYHFFLQQNQLAEKIAILYPIANSCNTLEIVGISKEIKELIADAPIPALLLQEITDAYRDWQTANSGGAEKGMVPVAVRSSATAEDLPGFSFAGLHDSYLNITSEKALLIAIKNCWASLWNSRAVAYRQHGAFNSSAFNSSAIGMAVIVQRFIPAEKSGILFTANPVNSSPEELWINAVWGLGESAVSGKSVPDTLVFNKLTHTLVRQEIARQELMTTAGKHGTEELRVPAPLRGVAVLDCGERTALLQQAGAIESYFGTAQDIEWAIAGRIVYILQSRPITRLFDPPAKAGTPEVGTFIGNNDWPVVGEWKVQPFDEWTRANVGELWRDPVSPIVASTVPLIISGAVSHSFHGIDPAFLNQIQWAKRLMGRIYYNEGALRYLLSKKLGLPPSMMDKSRGNIRGNQLHEQMRVNPVRIILHLPILLRLARKQFTTGNHLEKFSADCDRWSEDFMNSRELEKDDKKLWETAMVWLERTKYALKLQNDMSGFAATAFAALERLTTKWLNDKDLSLELISGIPGVQAAKIGAALWEMAAKIRDLGFAEQVLREEPLAVLNQLRKDDAANPIMVLLDRFLKEHGHRCPNEAEWLNPRWADQPEEVITLIKGYLNNLDQVEVTEDKVKQRQDEIVKTMLSKLNWFKRKIMRIVLHRAQHGVLLRDNGKSYAIKASYPARKICSVLGQRWARKGWLEKEEDIYFLTIIDIEKVITSESPIPEPISFHSIVAERRKAFNYWFTVNAPTSLDANGQPFPDEKVTNRPSALQGIAASKGRVQGKARIILSPIEALKMQPDEILVTRATDAGWSAVFPVIAGLVTEIGGQLSHAAILAREYRLPAVVNVQDATTKLHDGQIITLDGNTGDIFIGDENKE